MGRITLVILGLLLLTGCSGDVQVPGQTDEAALEVPQGPVAIKRVDRDKEKKEIVVTLATGEGERRVRIVPCVDGPLPFGIAAEISDTGGVLYAVTLAWDPEEPDRSWLMERTEENVMTASMHRVGDRVIELYDIDGDVFEVDYPALDPETRRRAIVHSRYGWQPESPDVAEFLGKCDEFETFYAAHAGNTLHNNADGELLVSLLTNEPFVGAAVGAKDGGGPTLLDDRLEGFCVLVSACARLKCMFGGWTNPVCVACSGAATACLIIAIVCWFLNC